MRDRLALDEFRTIDAPLRLERARLRCGWLAVGVGRIRVVSATTVEVEVIGADGEGRVGAWASCAWATATVAFEIDAEGSGFKLAAAVCGTAVMFVSWAATGGGVFLLSAVPSLSAASAASRPDGLAVSFPAGARPGEGGLEAAGEGESVEGGDISSAGDWPALFVRSSSYPTDEVACRASNDSTIALTMVGPAADAAGPVLRLLARLRFPVRRSCSMLLDVLNNRRPSDTAGDVVPSILLGSGASRKSLASMDSGVNVCSARATNGRGEEGSEGREEGDAESARREPGASGWPLPSPAGSPSTATVSRVVMVLQVNAACDKTKPALAAVASAAAAAAGASVSVSPTAWTV